jgi:hypothetical protein
LNPRHAALSAKLAHGWLFRLNFTVDEPMLLHIGKCSLTNLPRSRSDAIWNCIRAFYGGGDGGLGSLPLSRRPLLIHECDRVTLRDAIKHFIIGKVLALLMAFEANDANLNMTRFTTCCIANWANESQSRSIINHIRFLLPFHLKEMVKNERCAIFH